MMLLAELQAALAAQQVRSVLARNHRVVLRYGISTYGLSGLTDPALHILGPDGTDIARTDGSTYQLASGGEYAACDPHAAATRVAATGLRQGRPAARRA